MHQRLLCNMFFVIVASNSNVLTKFKNLNLKYLFLKFPKILNMGFNSCRILFYLYNFINDRHKYLIIFNHHFSIPIIFLSFYKKTNLIELKVNSIQQTQFFHLFYLSRLKINFRWKNTYYLLKMDKWIIRSDVIRNKWVFIRLSPTHANLTNLVFVSPFPSVGHCSGRTALSTLEKRHHLLYGQ